MLRIALCTHDPQVQVLVEGQKAKDFLVSNDLKRVEKFIADSEVGTVLIIDTALGEEIWNSFNQHFCHQKKAIRVLISHERGVKFFKSHQFGEWAAQSYLKWPVKTSELALLLQDLSSTHAILGEEGIKVNQMSKNPEDLTFIGIQNPIPNTTASTQASSPVAQKAAAIPEEKSGGIELAEMDLNFDDEIENFSEEKAQEKNDSKSDENDNILNQLSESAQNRPLELELNGQSEDEGQTVVVKPQVLEEMADSDRQAKEEQNDDINELMGNLFEKDADKSRGE